MTTPARSPDIQERTRWLEQNFPQLADRVIFIAHGNGESASGIMQAEAPHLRQVVGERAFPEATEWLNELLGEHSYRASVSHTFPVMAAVKFPSPEDARGPNLPHPFPEFFPADKREWRNMLQTYIMDQETIHAVDHLTPDKAPAGIETPQCRIEAIGEIYSVLSLMQRSRRGEFTEPVDGFLERMKLAQRMTQLSSGEDRELDGHVMVDDAMEAAVKCGKALGNQLTDMTPRQMLTEARKLANGLSYPTRDELEAYTARSSLVLITGREDQFTLPSLNADQVTFADGAKIAEQAGSQATSRWEQNQWRQIAGAYRAMADSTDPTMRAAVIRREYKWKG